MPALIGFHSTFRIPPHPFLTLRIPVFSDPLESFRHLLARRARLVVVDDTRLSAQPLHEPRVPAEAVYVHVLETEGTGGVRAGELVVVIVLDIVGTCEAVEHDGVEALERGEARWDGGQGEVGGRREVAAAGGAIPLVLVIFGVVEVGVGVGWGGSVQLQAGTLPGGL